MVTRCSLSKAFPRLLERVDGPDVITCWASSLIRVYSTPGADRSLSTSLRNREFSSLKVLMQELEGLKPA
jgi:hypothetical protein